MEYLSKLSKMFKTYPKLTKAGAYAIIVMIALVLLSVAFNLFFSFRISIYRQTIYDLKAQMYARQAEAKHAQIERDLFKKKAELEVLKRKGEEYAKQRGAKRKEIAAAKKNLAAAKRDMEVENSRLEGRTQEEVTSRANVLLNKNKGKAK